jgi:hypothetical protein
MSSNHPKSLADIISVTQSSFGRLALEARARLGLTDHIRAGLPADLANQMISCNLDPDGLLIVRTSGPEWAARFRFESDRILTLCRQKHAETKSVKIRVTHPDY